ncbi:MAG: beta strand repeat-containing protein [Thalassotalea sp.]
MKLLRHLSCLMLIFTIISCGGSGGSLSRVDTGGEGGTTGTLKLEITADTTLVTRNNAAQITATLTSNGVPVENKIIDFQATIGTLSKTTAVTNELGIATTSLVSGSDIGNGIVTASYDSLSLPFEVLLLEVRDLALTISDANVLDNTPVTITATLLNDGVPLTNQLINFSSTKGALEVDAVSTDSSGIATLRLSAGSDKGAGTIVATYDNITETIPFVILGRNLSIAASNTQVSAAQPANITVQLLNGTQPIAGEIVTFSTDLGNLSPRLGKVLTNSSGIAGIVLTAGDVKGAGTVTAMLSDDMEETINFESQGDDIAITGDINILLTLVDSDGNPTETISSSKPGRIIATVNGITAPEIVTFTSTLGDIPIATAITNGSNQATVDIVAGSDLGAGIITAKINSGETGNSFVIIGATDVRMGSGSPFQESVADTSLSTISAGGTTVISVDIVDDAGNLFAELVQVNFSSSCTSAGTATLSSPIVTSNGQATSTYLAQGCVGDDTISVSANAGGINLSATATISVLPASVGSIEFESAFPGNISILGAGAVGGSESSTVKFKVLDTNGNPVNNKVVNFALNTNVGGISIIPTSATTNAQGIVQTVINSGTVATSVRVQATIDGSSPDISSQSSVLVVSTGIPDQDSFSLSADIANPEGWNRDGTEVQVTARLADAFNNPVPDGTAVSFTTEGGAIDPSCVTTKGACTVTWRSQQPRPEGHVLGDDNNLLAVPELSNTMGQKYGGRATIIATAIGEESFPDLNGNGRFDESEYTAFLGTNISGEPYDLTEAFVDHNEDGLYNPAQGGDVNNSGSIEEFMDFDNSGDFTLADTEYNGVLCSLAGNQYCSTQKSLNVRASLTLIMSGSSAYILTTSTSDSVADPYDHDNDVGTPEIANPNNDPSDSTIYIQGESAGSASIIIADLHNQPMPAGTIVSFSAGVGSIVGTSSFTWPNDNHNGGRSFGVTVKGEKEPKAGNLVIQVTTPNGGTTIYSNIGIVIQ